MFNRLSSSFWFRLLLLAVLLFLILALPTRAAPALDAAIPHGAISGTITDVRTGQPVADAWAYVYKWDGDKANLLSYSTSNATGYYYVGQLPAGQYKTCFHSSSHVSECYDDWPDGTAATRIAVGVDEIVWNINAKLTPAGRICGKATDALNGSPIPQSRVVALKWEYPYWREARETVTDKTGRYDLSGLAAGSYRVRVTDLSGGHAEGYYGDGLTVETAANVGVGSGRTVDGIDIQLIRLGSISGRVQSLNTGEALPGITVWLGGWPPVESVVTDRLGAYEFTRLKAGEYTVSFIDPTHTYAQCSYSGEAGQCWAKTVRVVDGQAMRGINQKLPQTGSLLATVVDAVTGAPVPGIVVTLYWNGFYEEISQTTDVAGRVKFTQLELSSYYAYLSDPAGGYRATWAAGGPFQIEPGTNTLTWQMQPATAPNGRRNVRGRVTDADTGQPLAGIQVTAQYEDCHWRNGCDWHPVTSTMTAADGTYEFVDLPLSERLEATDPAGVYEPEVPTFHYPEPGETVVADVAMRTIVSIYGWINGRVTDTTGRPVSSKYGVSLVRLDAAGYSYSGDLDANGEYSIRVMPGSYRVQFNANPAYITEFYDNAVTEDQATPVTARVGETTTVNASLRMRGRFTGRVTDAAGRPISGASVLFYSAPWQSHFTYTLTDGDGRYSSPYLDDGAYRAYFHADKYDDAVWGGGSDISAAADITVKADTVVEGIDATLGPLLGALTGRVTDRLTGEPLAGIHVYESRGWTYSVTASDGVYLIPNLRVQTYQLVARDWSGRYPEQSAPAQISAPVTTTVDLQLDLPGHITGRVTDINGAPLSGIEVTFRQGCCGGRVVETDDDGRYDSGPLMGGGNTWRFQYIVVFSDPTERFVTEYHNDARRQEDATLVTVNPGTLMTADAVLDAGGKVSGKVIDARTGLPIPRVTVSMPVRQYVDRSAVTGDDGTYFVDRLPIGPNTLSFIDCCRRYVTVNEPMTVTENMALGGHDIALTPWGALSGRVTDEATGAGLSRAWVTLYRADEKGWVRVSAVVTDAEGQYTFARLDGGAYRIEFSHPQDWYRTETYPDAPSVVEGADVVFTPGQDTPNIDAALASTDVPHGAERLLYLPALMR